MKLCVWSCRGAGTMEQISECSLAVPQVIPVPLGRDGDAWLLLGSSWFLSL